MKMKRKDQAAARQHAHQQRAVRPPAPPQLVQIEKPIYGGSFLARVEGKALFVPMALPGEQARVRITEEKRGYAAGEIDEIVAAAPERIQPACRHFGECGGCSYQHAPYETQLAFKEAILRETLERGGVRAPDKIAVIAGEPWGYRNRIRMAFNAKGEAGYRARRSNAIVPIAECPIAAPLLVRAALKFAQAARKVAPEFRVTELALFSDAAERELLASVFATSAAKKKFDELAHIMAAEIPELKGAELVEPGDAPIARRLARWGEAAIPYEAADFAYRVDHGAFFQVNRWLVDRLVERATSGARGKIAWDLFAGVGLFARKLTASFERVVAVESAPAAEDALNANLDGTGATAVRATTLEFLRRTAREERPDLVIVDPPRTGLGVEVTALLAETESPEIRYVSCDPATLARDLRALVAAGYAIEDIALCDLFPQTSHLETVARLRRA